MCLQALCAKGSQIIQVKSINVENAANELISILCDAHQTARDEMDEDDSDSDEDEGGEWKLVEGEETVRGKWWNKKEKKGLRLAEGV